MKNLISILLSSAFFIGHSLAGSRVWQPSVPAKGEETHERRYFHIDTDVVTKANDRVIWPNKQIRYCYESSSTKSRLRKDLKAAHERWVTTGLGKGFTFVEVGKGECKDKRSDVLLVKYTGPNGALGTYAGFPSKGATIRSFTNEGPTMQLTDSTSKGMLDRVANYAHELGHAWGLYHEHQNPAFWSGVDLATGGSVFGPDNNDNWRCENLSDYASKVNGLLVQQGDGGQTRLTQDKLCSNMIYARNAEFSASDYLPFPSSAGIAHSSGKDEGDVDFESLMIYPSGAGGIGDAAPGTDNRLPILLKPDGSRIKIHDYPSQLDIQGLLTLYGSEPAAKNLLQKVGGKTTEMFKKYFGKSKGEDSTSGCL